MREKNLFKKNAEYRMIINFEYHQREILTVWEIGNVIPMTHQQSCQWIWKLFWLSSLSITIKDLFCRNRKLWSVLCFKTAKENNIWWEARDGGDRDKVLTLPSLPTASISTSRAPSTNFVSTTGCSCHQGKQEGRTFSWNYLCIVK